MKAEDGTRSYAFRSGNLANQSKPVLRTEAKGLANRGQNCAGAY